MFIKKLFTEGESGVRSKESHFSGSEYVSKEEGDKPITLCICKSAICMSENTLGSMQDEFRQSQYHIHFKRNGVLFIPL